MLIAVNTRFLLHNKLEGIGRFTYETLSRMVKAHPEHRFLFLFDRRHHPSFVFGDNVTPIELFPQARHPILYYWWFEFSVAAALEKYRPDVFLSMDGYLSLRSDVPQVPVFHDLAFEHFPQGISLPERIYYRHFFPKYARKAQRLVAVSEFTRHDIVEQYGIDPARIDVVYNAAAGGFRPLDEPGIRKVREAFSQGEPYFLYVGAMHPRKNIHNLLRAFDAFKASSGSRFKLLVVGRKAWKSKAVDEAYNGMKYRDEVIFTGRVAEDDLHRITGAAYAMVYVPFFEGFGLPLVEAMACDVPLITSAVSSMPEVAGDAALLVDPGSIDDISAAMNALAGNTGLYLEKKRASTGRKHRFSWDESAAKLWDTVQKAAINR